MKNEENSWALKRLTEAKNKKKEYLRLAQGCDKLISAYQEMVGGRSDGVSEDTETAADVAIVADEFKNKTIIDAAKSYLAKVGGASDMTKMVKDLKKGGREVAYNTLYGVLRREWKVIGDVKKADRGRWELVRNSKE